MIFSELYSVYYTTVAKILTRALEPDVTERDLQQLVTDYAFSESSLSILPALKSGKWPLLRQDLTPAVKRSPAMPLTTLERRWLKSLTDDPRLGLFGLDLPDLQGVEPLFTRADYKLYDQYSDGDPFESDTYIRHFRLIRQAIREDRPVEVTLENQMGRVVRIRFRPVGLEYSQKDDKIRILATGCRYPRYNLGRIRSCRFYTGSCPLREAPAPDRKRDLTVEITDQRNAMERAMLHFAHFEKRAERVDQDHYRLTVTYYNSDETELVIRVLSFGPCLRVLEPDSFVDLIKARLERQKSCGLL